MLRLLSLGAGVQSSTVLYMSIVGELPRLDGCIFADTGDEPEDVYRHLEYLRELSPYPIHVVERDESIANHVIKRQATGQTLYSPPFYTRGENGKPSVVNRDCTRQWKVRPIEAKTRDIAGFKRFNKRDGLQVETWLGISWDERRRMKVSTSPWQRFWHPLIEAEWGESRADVRERPMTRAMCEEWIREHGFRMPPKSACWHCPYRSGKNNAGWRHLRDNCPDDFARAVAFDLSLREGGRKLHGMKEHVYLHPSLRPLGEVDLGDDKDESLPLFDDECSGICGV